MDNIYLIGNASNLTLGLPGSNPVEQGRLI